MNPALFLPMKLVGIDTRHDDQLAKDVFDLTFQANAEGYEQHQSQIDNRLIADGSPPIGEFTLTLFDQALVASYQEGQWYQLALPTPIGQHAGIGQGIGQQQHQEA